VTIKEQFEEETKKLETEIRDLGQRLATETENVEQLQRVMEAEVQAEAHAKVVTQKRHLKALQAAEDQHRQEIESESAEIRKLQKRYLKTLQTAEEQHRKEVEAKASEIHELAHQLEIESQAKTNILAEMEEAKRVIKRLRSRATQLKHGLASAGHENEENKKQMNVTLKTTKNALRARIIEFVERLRVQSGDSVTAQQLYTEKINALETQIAELRGQLIEADLKKRKSETLITGILAQCDREKKVIQATLTAQIHALEVEDSRKQDEYHLALTSFKGSVFELVNTTLGQFVEGIQRIDEQNFEWSLNVVKKKLENSHWQDLRIWAMLSLELHDSIEDAISHVLARKSHRSGRCR
jgi:chromosome segregation ATPase